MQTVATGDKRYKDRIVPFKARDGRLLELIHVTGEKEPTRGPVLLVHGAGVRSNIYRAPVRKDFVEALLDHGYDVWLEDWRASIDFAPSQWTLDQAAINDHPAAVDKVLEETGTDEMKAVIHCQGSTSFTMSAMAGLVPNVRTIVTNAVSLHTVVPRWSVAKLNCVSPILSLFSKYLNPHWGVEAPGLFPKLVRLLVNLTHHECDNAVCKGVSFTYGSGCPALWRHENLNEATHEWLKNEFGAVPMSFFHQMAKCVNKGNLVSVSGDKGLPADFARAVPKTDARFAFFTGEQNLCFLPESQIRSHAYFDSLRRGFHTLHVIPNYGHLDIFMGQAASDDVYPTLIEELDR